MSFSRLTFLAMSLSMIWPGCGRLEGRHYTLRGQVVSVAADRRAATIRHEDIPGLMSAMTMPYRVRDPQQLENMVPGDLITATLVVVSNDAYLTTVRRVGSAPLVAQDEGSPAASYGADLLKPGDRVPLTSFVDQDGRTRDFSSFRGAPAVVTFIYTRCPMPTFCPLMDRHFATIQARTKTHPLLKDLRLVSVSVDPAVDTPAVLKHHAETLGADPDRWTFLTGDRDDVDGFARQFGIALVREDNTAGDITHNLRTVLVDADGVLVMFYTGNEWTPDQLLADLERLD